MKIKQVINLKLITGFALLNTTCKKIHTLHSYIKKIVVETTIPAVGGMLATTDS